MANEHNKELDQAFEFVNGTNRNIFLTGKAGTGKTNFLKDLQKQSHKKMIVLAPTGVAAINAGGVTIHSIFPIPREPLVSSKTTILDNIRFTADNRDLFISLDLLVFDEASMIRADVLDAVDYLLRKVRKCDYPFGGLQVLFIGDLYQLSPIAKPDDERILATEYSSPFIIDSKVFRLLDLVYVELKKVYRQADQRFLELLESIRTATCTTEQLASINQLYRPNQSAPDGWITLTTHVRQADQINNESLNQLEGDEVCLKAKITGEFEINFHPVPNELKLKNGTQVMLVRNDSSDDKKYFNGKIGRITSISPDTVIVEFQSNDSITLKREIWVNSKYRIDENKDQINSETLGTFEQFPIKPAWAITIHKSQGLTFNCAVIDAGAAFAPGQVYVAFSRLRSLENVWLRSKITGSSMSLNPVIERFEKLKSNQTNLEIELPMAQEQYLKSTLLHFFDWQGLQQCVDTIPPLAADIFTTSRKSLVEDLQHSTIFREQLEKSASWNNQMDFSYLLDRIGKAKIHFEPRLRDILNAYRDYIKTNKKDIHHKRNVPLAQHFVTCINGALASLEMSERLINLLIGKVALGEALNSLKRKKTVHANSKIIDPNQNLSTERVSLHHFRNGKSVIEIAQLRNLNIQTIEYQLASLIKSGEVEISELIAPALWAQIHPVASKITDQSLLNLKKHFGTSLSLGQIAALREYLTM